MMDLWLLHCVLFIVFFLWISNVDFSKLPITRVLKYSSQKNGQDLFITLLNAPHKLVGKGGEISLPQYKFYTDIVNELILTARKFGTPISKSITEIKKALTQDMNFEKKIRSMLLGGIYQMLLISGFAWIFYFFARVEVGINISTWDLSIVILIQVLGLLVFIVLFVLLKTKSFGPWQQYLMSLYKLRAMINAQMPISLISKKIDFNQLKDSKYLSPIKLRIHTLVDQVKDLGYVDQRDYDDLIGEMWYLGEFNFEQFLKHLNGAKLLVITCFSLPSYLYVLYLFLNALNL